MTFVANLNFLAAVFLCFALSIVKTKATYYTNPSECYSLDVIADPRICHLRKVRLLWSIPVGWSAFVSLTLLFLVWILTSRVVRFEKIKASLL